MPPKYPALCTTNIYTFFKIYIIEIILKIHKKNCFVLVKSNVLIFFFRLPTHFGNRFANIVPIKKIKIPKITTKTVSTRNLTPSFVTLLITLNSATIKTKQNIKEGDITSFSIT